MTFFSSKVAGRLGSLDLLEIPTGRADCGEYDSMSLRVSQTAGDFLLLDFWL